TYRAAGEGAGCNRRQEDEQIDLALLDAQAEALDQVEGEVVGEGGDVDELGEHQDGDHHDCLNHLCAIKTYNLVAGEALQLRLPVPDGPRGESRQHEDRQRRGEHEPGDRVLSVGNDDGRSQQRADGRTRIAADLEGRL